MNMAPGDLSDSLTELEASCNVLLRAAHLANGEFELAGSL